MKHPTPSTFVKVLVPLVLVGIAVFQVLANKGHVDDNVIGALVFIGVGGTAGYAIDRLIQNIYWARTTGGVDRQHDDHWDEEDEDDPRPAPPRSVKRRRQRQDEVPPERYKELLTHHPGLIEEAHTVPDSPGPAEEDP